jgi:hypothetical protein
MLNRTSFATVSATATRAYADAVGHGRSRSTVIDKAAQLVKW